MLEEEKGLGRGHTASWADTGPDTASGSVQASHCLGGVGLGNGVHLVRDLPVFPAHLSPGLVAPYREEAGQQGAQGPFGHRGTRSSPHRPPAGLAFASLLGKMH